jgi:hypothetical protein
MSAVSSDGSALADLIDAAEKLFKICNKAASNLSDAIKIAEEAIQDPDCAPCTGEFKAAVPLNHLNLLLPMWSCKYVFEV